jgi:hypothetical protein
LKLQVSISLFFFLRYGCAIKVKQFKSKREINPPYQRVSVLLAAKVSTSIQTETLKQDGAAFESRI